jgi:histidinol-phosphate aminotransferase
MEPTHEPQARDGTRACARVCRAIAPYVGGKPVEEVARELGLDPANIIKLASNENPRGPSQRARGDCRRGSEWPHALP